MTGLTGRVAVVTGAASGMGRAITVALQRAGVNILAADVNASGLDDLVAELGSAVVPHVVNLAEAEEVSAMVDAAVEQFGTIDILVNNAGVMDVYQGVATMDVDIWRRMFAINLDAPMHAMRRAVPLMLEKGRGVIVNIASVAGARAGAAGTAYTASKHALVGLSRSTAWMYADRGIRCNLVMPGATNTNVKASMIGKFDAAGQARAGIYQQCIPQRLEAEDIAHVVMFLVSDAAERINGAEVAADAGWMTV